MSTELIQVEKKAHVKPKEDKVDIPIESEELESPKVVGKIDLESMNLRTRPPKKSYKEREVERKKADDELQKSKRKKVEPEETEIPEAPKDDVIRAKADKLSGPTVVGKIDLPAEKDGKKLVASSSEMENNYKKKKRRRIHTDNQKISVGTDKNKAKPGDAKKELVKKKPRRIFRQEVSEEDVQKQIKDTLARLTSKGKSKTSK